MYSLSLKETNLVFIGSGSLLVKEVLTNKETINTEDSTRLVLDASTVTSEDVDQLVRVHKLAKGNVTLVLKRFSESNAFVEPLLLVAKELGVDVDETTEAPDVSLESIGREALDATGLTTLEEFDEGGVSFYAYPAGSPLSFLFSVNRLSSLDTAMLEYNNLAEKINKLPHIFYLPEGEVDDEVMDYVTDAVDAQQGVIIRNLEEVLLSLSTEGIREVFKNIIEFFKPLPKDHIKKVTKRASKISRYLISKNDYRPILDMLDTYFDNEEWMGLQAYKEDKLKANYVITYLSTNGHFDLSELPKTVTTYMKDFNAFAEEFHKEATRFLKELNDLFDKFKKSIAFTAIADDIKDVVTSSRKNRGKDDLANKIASVVSSSSVAAGLLLESIQKLQVPIQNINLSKYTILSYNASRAKGSWGEFEKMKLVVDPLKPEEFKTVCDVIRQLATFKPVIYDESSYNIRRFNFNEKEVLSRSFNGRRLLDIYDDYGFYSVSGYVNFPDAYRIHYRVVAALITWMYDSLNILEPRSVK